MLGYKSVGCELPFSTYFNEAMGTDYFSRGTKLFSGSYSNIFDYDLNLTYLYSAKSINIKHLPNIPMKPKQVDATSVLLTDSKIAYWGCSSLLFKHVPTMPTIVKLFKTQFALNTNIKLGLSFTELDNNYNYSVLFQMLDGSWIEYAISNDVNYKYKETSVKDGLWICKEVSQLGSGTIKAIYLCSYPNPTATTSSVMHLGYFNLYNYVSSSANIVQSLKSAAFTYDKELKCNGNYKITLRWTQWENYINIVKTMQIFKYFVI